MAFLDFIVYSQRQCRLHFLVTQLARTCNLDKDNEDCSNVQYVISKKSDFINIASFSDKQNLQKANTDAELLPNTIDFILSHQLQIKHLYCSSTCS